MVIITNNPTKIEFFIRILDPQNCRIVLSGDKEYYLVLSPETQPLAHIKAELPPDTRCSITYTGIDICLGYYYEPQTVLSDGVTFLNPDGITIPRRHQERYHFTPYKNWMNDPNGLCRYQGYYHMFYQFHPYAQEPGCMYWGHAASKDLISWHHLPVVFSPQECILQDSSYRGGAWSGSALPLAGEVRLFFTRHIGPEVDRSVKHEYQVMVSSRDMVHFSDETVIIDGRPEEGVSDDIRDPKILRYQGSWYMVLGSACNHNPAVLLYRSDDLDNWTYQGILYQEISHDTVAFECPDLFELDGKFVLTLSKMRHTDEYGRKDTTHYYIGTFDGTSFLPEYGNILDFGGNLYAVQSFYHNGHRLAFGWVADFYREHIREGNSVYGSMSLPRELLLDPTKKKLLNRPVREAFDLLSDLLFQGTPAKLQLSLPAHAYYICILYSDSDEFNEFELILNKRGDNSALLMIGKAASVELKTTGTASENSRFLSPSISVHKIEIFMDYRTCEVFINDGEAAAVKTFYGDTLTPQISYCSQSRGCHPLLIIKNIPPLPYTH